LNGLGGCERSFVVCCDLFCAFVVMISERKREKKMQLATFFLGSRWDLAETTHCISSFSQLLGFIVSSG
jgi:hypothetical protein